MEGEDRLLFPVFQPVIAGHQGVVLVHLPKELSELLANAAETLGSAETVTVCEKLAEIGFDEATKSGLSIGIQDLTGAPSKQTIISRAEQKSMKLKNQVALDALESTDYQERFMSTWVEATEKVANELMHAMQRGARENSANPVFVMTDSGARGSVTQVKQLAGMRGLITKVSGEVSGHPITSNFREGLSLRAESKFEASCRARRKSSACKSTKHKMWQYAYYSLVSDSGPDRKY